MTKPRKARPKPERCPNLRVISTCADPDATMYRAADPSDAAHAVRGVIRGRKGVHEGLLPARLVPHAVRRLVPPCYTVGHARGGVAHTIEEAADSLYEARRRLEGIPGVGSGDRCDEPSAADRLAMILPSAPRLRHRLLHPDGRELHDPGGRFLAAHGRDVRGDEP